MVTLGNTKISKLYLGSTPVDKAYLGSQQVYPNASLALSADLLSFAAAGGSQELTVAVEEGQMWALSVPVGWSASSQSGTGTATLTLTIDNNTTTVARSGALTVASEDLTATCALVQAAGAKSYGEISIGAYGYGMLPAGGGTVSPTLAYSQPWTWNGVNGSGGTVTSGATVAYSASTKGTTESGQTTVATATVSVSLNGKSATKEAVVFQEANDATYGSVNRGKVTVPDIPASGGVVSRGVLDADYTQTVSYTSGATRPGEITYVWEGQALADSLGTTVQNRTEVGSIALRARGEGGKFVYNRYSIYQAGNYISSLAVKASTFSYGILGAGAASISPTVNADGAWTFTFSSGATSYEAPSSVYGIFSVGVTYSLGSVQNGFTAVDASTGTLTGTARGTEIGNARTSGIVTRKVDGVWTPAAAYNAAGTKTASASKTATCTQDANTRALSGLSAGCESSSNMPPDIRQHDWMGAAGGIFTFFCNANYSYTSGAKSLEDVRSSTAYTSLGEYAGITINGNTAIIPSRGTVEGSNRYNHFTASYGGKSVSWNTGQAANSRNLSSIRIAAYAADATWVQPADWGAVPAGGGYINFRRYTTYLYTSGSTIEEKNGADGDRSGMVLYEGGGWMEAWGNGGYHVLSRGVTVGVRRRGTIYWTYDGLTSNHLVLYQDANVLTWNDPVISRTTPVSIAAAGGTNNVASGLTYSQSGSYTSGSPASASSGGSLSYAVQTAKTGFSLSGSTVTATNNTGTSARNGFVVRITLTLNGKTATKDITYNQSAGSYTYANPVVSVTCADVPASGGSVTSGTVTYSQTYGWNDATSGAGALTSGGTVTWSGGASNIASLGTTIKSRTAVGSALVATVTMNGKSGSGSATVYQAENKVTNSNYNPRITVYGTPSVSIGSGITAAGGSATVSHSVSNTQTYNVMYSSGVPGPDQTRSVAGTPTIAMTGNGNNRFSLSGNIISHSSMGKNVTTDTVTIRCTNAGKTTVYKDASTSVSNSVGAWVDTGITAYGTPSVSIGSGLTTAGGSATVSHSVSNTMGQKRTYTSGSYDTQSVSRAGTTTIVMTGNGNNRFSLSGNTISHSSMGTNLTTDTVTVTATNSSHTSKTASASKSVTNGRTVTGTTGGVTTHGNVTAGTISNKTIPASGGSATATAGNGSQTWSKTATVTSYKYDSGDTSSATTENASSGTNTISPSVGSITASAASKGTTVSGTTTVKSQAVTWSGNGGKSTSGTMYVYQAANAVVSYAEISYNQFSYNRTIPYGGGTASPAGDITYKKSYSSGAKGPEEHGLPPGHSQYYVWTNSKPSWGDINSSTGVVTASANGNYSTRSASITVQITYNGSAIGVEATTTVTQAAYVKPTISLTFSYNQTGGTFVIYASQAVKDQLSIDYTYNDGGGMGGDGSITMGVNQTQVSGYAGGPDYPIAGITMVNFDSSGRLDTGNAIYTWTPV